MRRPCAWRLHASATLIRVLLATGRAAEAKTVADAGLAEAEQVGGIGLAEVRLHGKRGAQNEH